MTGVLGTYVSRQDARSTHIQEGVFEEAGFGVDEG